MKRNILTAVLGVFFATLSAFSFASDMPKAHWDKKIASDKEASQEYLEIYTILPNDTISCMVVLKKDGDIEAYAEDLDWYGKHVISRSSVSSTGGFVENDSVIMANGLPQRGGYWVFPAKCLDAAQSLPKEVRRKFHGSLGIE